MSNQSVPTADPLARASNVPYVVAIVIMSLIALAAVMGITIVRPEADNTQLIATVLGFVATTTASILALMKSQETHLTVNSQLAQWKQDFAALMRAEGAKAAVAEEQQRVADDILKKATAVALAKAGVSPPGVASEGSPVPVHIVGAVDIDAKNAVITPADDKPK